MTWRRRGLPMAATVLMLAVLVASGLLADRTFRASLDTRARIEVDELAARYANELEDAIDRRAQLTHGLRAFIGSRWGSPTFDEEFLAFGVRLLDDLPGTRAAQVVVGGRIELSAPEAGNETVRGFDLYQHPDSGIRADLRAAEVLERIVISGPVDFVQGGNGIIARRRVVDSAGRLLAIGQIVFDLAPILREADSAAGVAGLRLALEDNRGRPVVGPDSVFLAHPVLTLVRLPDRVWRLAAVPTDGWGATGRGLVLFRGALALAGLLLVGLTWVMTERQVREATEFAVRSQVSAEEKYARLFQLSPDGVSLTRVRDDRILEVNDSLVTLTGWPREELIGRSSLELGLWADPDHRSAALRELNERGEVHGVETFLRRKDGTRIECSFSSRIVEVDGEQCRLAVTRGIEQQRIYERHLAQGQKLEAIGRLAGGVAHDFNNIITAVLGYNQAAAEALDPAHAVQEDLRQVHMAAERAADLTRQLLTFSRGQVGRPKPVDLEQRVRATVGLLARLVGEDVRLVLDFPEPLPPVKIDPTQLERIIVNLAVNARDAMPGGGTIFIMARPGEAGVELKFQDTGTGILLELQAKIFEPFFTTKDASRGAGLGLSAVYAIVRDAGGRISVDSEPGQGATFKIWFPAMPGTTSVPEVRTRRASAAPLPRGTETILLAEDDPQIRELATRALAGLGYQVLPAENGRVCLLRDAAHSGPIGLLLTDVVMPGLSGPDLALEVRRRHAGLPVLYMSGYTADTQAIERALREGGRLLPKPFTVAELAAEVRRALDRRGEGSG